MTEATTDTTTTDTTTTDATTTDATTTDPRRSPSPRERPAESAQAEPAQAESAQALAPARTRQVLPRDLADALLEEVGERVARPRPGRPEPSLLAPPRRVELLGIQVDDLTMDEAAEQVGRLCASPEPKLVVTPNVDHLVRLQTDPEFRAIYRSAALVLADGMPLVWASRLLGAPLRERVTGADLLWAMAPVAARDGLRVFYLGGRPGAAEGAAAALRARHPDLKVCGTLAPPPGFDRCPYANREAINAVRAARPDLLFVAIGSPRQEYWAWRHRERLAVPVSIGVGASLDFAAGLVERAPVWYQRNGLEWAWRLAAEPGRLWRRYLVRDMQFFPLLLRHLVPHLWGRLRSAWRGWRGRRAPTGPQA